MKGLAQYQTMKLSWYFSKMLEECPNYFKNDPIVILNFKSGKCTIKTENLFQKKVPDEIVAYRIIHLTSMFSTFAAMKFDEDLMDEKILNDRNMELRLEMKMDSVNILSHDGFGLFGPKMKYMVPALMKASYSLEQYFGTLTNFKYSERIKEFWKNHSTLDGIDYCCYTFIEENKDVFLKYSIFEKELSED